MGIVLFILIRIIVGVLSLLFKNVPKPSVTFRVLGFLVGLIKGAFYTVLILCVLSVMPFSFMDKYNEQLDKSLFAGKVSEISVKLGGKLLESKPESSRYKKIVKIYTESLAPSNAEGEDNSEAAEALFSRVDCLEIPFTLDGIAYKFN